MDRRGFLTFSAVGVTAALCKIFNVGSMDDGKERAENSIPDIRIPRARISVFYGGKEVKIMEHKYVRMPAVIDTVNGILMANFRKDDNGAVTVSANCFDVRDNVIATVEGNNIPTPNLRVWRGNSVIAEISCTEKGNGCMAFDTHPVYE